MRKPTAVEFESFSFSLMCIGLGWAVLIGISYAIWLTPLSRLFIR